MSRLPASLPPEERVRKGRQFRWILRHGRRIRTAHFTVVVAKARQYSRLGLTVSRKCGNAVERNHVKRRVREWYRHHKNELRPPQWVVVIAKPGSAGLSSADIGIEMASAFARLDRPGRRQ